MFANVTSLPFDVHQLHRRAQVLATALLRIEHHGAGQASDLVHLGGDRHAVDEVLELQQTGHFRDDRVRMRIPGRDDLAAATESPSFAVIMAPYGIL